MSDIITAENLQLWYGETHALKGIDMENLELEQIVKQALKKMLRS